MSLTADDVNFLVYRYLQESGFVHAAYAFRGESDVARLDMDHDNFECGALVKLVQRGLQYMELEANATRDDAGSHDTRFEILTASDILRAKTAATLKAVVAERREHSASTARGAPAARDCAACGVALDTQAEAVFAARWDASGTRLACYSQGTQCSVWEVGPSGGGGAAAAPPRRITLRREGSAVGASAPLVWSPDGLQVAMGMDDGWVCVFSADGDCLHQLSGHTVAGKAAGENAILDLAFSPDSAHLLTACGNGSVILWSCPSGTALAQFTSHAAAAEAVAWRGDGGVFASSSWDGEIHVYRLEGGDGGAVRGVRVRELKGHTVGVDNIVWAPNQWLLASYAEKHIKLWSMHQSSCLCDLIDEECDSRDGDAHASHNDSVLSIAFRPAGPGSRNPGLALQLATTGEDARAKVWDCENGSLLHSLSHRPGTLLSCDWSPEGLTLATGHADGTVTLWDANEGVARREYTAAAGVFSVAWNVDGERIAVSTKSGTVIVLDTRR